MGNVISVDIVCLTSDPFSVSQVEVIMISLRSVIWLMLLPALSACTMFWGSWPAPTVIQRGPTEVVVSPTGRYVTILSVPDPAYYAFTEFMIFDTQNFQINHQLSHHPDAIAYHRGLFRGTQLRWTPTENYLIVIGRTVVSSHGCAELFVYTGDGRDLVFSSGNTTSPCLLLDMTSGMRVHKLCSNDDIVYNGYRLTPSTGEYVELPIPFEAGVDLCPTD